ncbi:hypothetical protein F0U61_31250 [Archangium violaceum]|uniref:hypothetical protein n=1 Tax=Archangium violaceum TaxID=83451 RepID=UPI002B2C4BE7|nr:hypothetical protein F0U61_31250 [Archangium violaceum]
MLYEAMRDNFATLLAETGEVGRGPPRYVERDFAKYLECGVLAHGFTWVRSESWKANRRQADLDEIARMSDRLLRAMARKFRS